MAGGNQMVGDVDVLAGERTDEELIRATRDGDPTAYGELYLRHYGAARRLARRLCAAHEADDVVADVFGNTLRAIRNGHGPQDDFAPYVLRSVRHQAGRARRRGDGGRAVCVEDDRLDDLLVWYDTDVTGRSAITDAFATLPERFRLVLWQTEVEGRTHAEIGATLGLGENAVAALARRARVALSHRYLDVNATGPAGGDARCRRTRQILASYVRGSLRPSSRARIDAHLAECQECATASDEMQHLEQSLRSAPWLAVGALSTPRWVLLLQRLLSGFGAAGVPKIAATAAIGLSAVAAPQAMSELTERLAGDRDRLAITAPASGRDVAATDRPSPAALGTARTPGSATTADTSGSSDVTSFEQTPAEADTTLSVAPDSPAASSDPIVDAPTPTDSGSATVPESPSIDDDPADMTIGPTADESAAPEGTTGVEVDLLDGTATIGVATDDALAEVDLLDGTATIGVATDDALAEVDVDQTATVGVATDDALAEVDLLDGTATIGVATEDALLDVSVGGDDGLLDDGGLLGGLLRGLFGG